MEKVTIIIPAYNEEAGIQNTLNTLLPYVEKQGFEVLVINDGSLDGTRRILESTEEITVVNHPYNKGYGAALKTGIKKAANSILVFYNADGQQSRS